MLVCVGVVGLFVCVCLCVCVCCLVGVVCWSAPTMHCLGLCVLGDVLVCLMCSLSGCVCCFRELGVYL